MVSDGTRRPTHGNSPFRGLTLRRPNPLGSRDRERRHPRSREPRDRKSTRLNSSHSQISYAVFCLKKKAKKKTNTTIKRNKTHNTTQYTTHSLTILSTQQLV